MNTYSVVTPKLRPTPVRWALTAWFRGWPAILGLGYFLLSLVARRPRLWQALLFAGLLLGVRMLFHGWDERDQRSDWHVQWGWGIGLSVICLVLFIQALEPLSGSDCLTPPPNGC